MREPKPLIDFLVRGLIYILAVSSIATSIIDSLYLPIPYTRVCIIALIFYIVLSLYLYNRFSILIGLPISIYLFLLYASKQLSMGWWHIGIEQVYLLIGHIVGNSPAIEHIYISWSLWIITGTISLIFFLLIVKLDMPMVAIFFGALIIGVQWFLGHYHITPYIWVYVLVAICLISSKHRKILSRKYSMPQYGIWQLSVIPVALAIVLVAISTVPADTSHLKWKYLENQFSNLEDRWASARNKRQMPRTSFRLTQTGFQTSSHDLGGPIQIEDGLILRVKSPIPLNLRGTALNEYTGMGWIDSTRTMKYKFGDLFNTKNKDLARDFDESFWSDLDLLEDQKLISRFTIDIEPVGIEASTLFAPLRTVGIRPHIRREFVPYINDKGELFTANNITDIEGYSLDIVYLQSRNRDILSILNNYILPLDFREYIANAHKTSQKVLDIQKYYTTLNDSIPKRVIELAEDITGHITSPVEKALALEDYLLQNYDYTLTPPHTPQGRDFVDYFLFDLHQGYCTYFASAMAVMGRTVGLATRYVEGFSMPPKAKHGMVYEIQKSNSHAWVEVYFPGVGWVDFDPTPASYLEDIIVDEDSSTQTEFEGPYPDIYEDFEFHEETDYIDRDGLNYNIEEEQFTIDMKIILIVICVFIALTTLFIVFIVLLIYIYRRRIAKLPPSRQVGFLYNRIIELLTLYNFPIESGETPYTYADRVDTWLINEAGSMTDVATLIVKINFSGYEASRDDVSMVNEFYNNLKRDTRGVIGCPKYIMAMISKLPSFFPRSNS